MSKKSEHLDRRNHHRRLGDRVVLGSFQYRPEFFRDGGSAGDDALLPAPRPDPRLLRQFPVGCAAHPDRDGLHFDAAARIHRVLHRFRFHRFGRPVHAESPTSNR